MLSLLEVNSKTKPMRSFFSFVLIVFFFHSSVAQSDSTTSVKPTLKFDLNYLSNNVYLGRKDSNTISYVTPGIFYTAPSGFFASANLSFVTQEHRIDAVTLEAGYDLSAGNFDANLSAMKSFYSQQSVNVRSAEQGGFNAYLSYETPYLTPVVNAGLALGNNPPDYFLGFGLEHSFVSTDNAFAFTPAFTANGSTQNFYASYYKFRKNNKKKKTAAMYSIEQQALNASTFKILDYEISADLLYKVKRFSFYLTPVYAIATNPNVIVTTFIRPNGTVLGSQTKTETLGNNFYCTVGVSYKLRTK